MNRQWTVPRIRCALGAALLWFAPVLATAQDAPSPGDLTAEKAPVPETWHLFGSGHASYTWLPQGGRDGLGVTELDLTATCNVPLPGDCDSLRITPGFVLRSWNGPDSAAVGTSGNSRTRSIVPTATILTLPSRCSGSDVVGVSNMKST